MQRVQEFKHLNSSASPQPVARFLQVARQDGVTYVNSTRSIQLDRVHINNIVTSTGVYCAVHCYYIDRWQFLWATSVICVCVLA